MEFASAFDQGYFAANVGIEDGFKGEDLSEKGMEFEVDGFDGDVVVCRDTGTGLRG